MIFSIYGFFVPEGHMIVARRFIAGSGATGTDSPRRDARMPAQPCNPQRHRVSPVVAAREKTNPPIAAR
jgi:hypothetical protein